MSGYRLAYDGSLSSRRGFFPWEYSPDFNVSGGYMDVWRPSTPTSNPEAFFNYITMLAPGDENSNTTTDDSPQDAVRYDENAIRARCERTVNIYDVPSVPGAAGQTVYVPAGPNSPARWHEQVSFSRGGYRNVVLRELERRPSDHDEIIRLAQMQDAVRLQDGSR